ncbi:general secretion pathway protein GspK [Maridesulfovibrio zosterae]|uniref:general secretion pathway protein GspK n=1 Tax=Maridesulfovibrio zosterae TaxID=82171 RepID=UPI0004197342|nr:type II secretion system protein GspK [Maridesulfovibrio zosterae]
MSLSSVPEKSRGVVLIIVLVLFMALSGLTLMTIDVSSKGAVEAAKVRSEYEAHFLAEEALFLIYKQLQDDKTPFSDTAKDHWARKWEGDGVWFEITPCNAKVNLNDVANIQDTKKILDIMGRILPAGTDVERLVGSLGVWTGKKVSSTLKKIDSLFYATQYPSYSPTGRVFVTPEEVTLVNGWRDFDREWIDENFTVWGSEGKININFASPETLLAYFPKLSRSIKNIIHWRNTRGFTDLSQVISVAGIQADSELYKNMLNYLSVKSDIFEARVVASVSGCRVVKRYIISRPSTFETELPNLIFQNDVSVTFDSDQ